MNAPTHIRFTHDEAEAIDDYAAQHGLRKASAVRELLKLGLDAVHAARNGTANDAHAPRLQRIEDTLATIQREHSRQLDSILQQLHELSAAQQGSTSVATPKSA